MEQKKKDEWMSLPVNEKQLHDLFRRGKRHPAMKMADIAMKMKRSPNQVFVLLVGLSGAGKSSTVNYLFETNVAETSELRSETRSTIEYTVQMKSTEWRIPDLQLSIIDTPGFCDTDGLEQDAKNIMSIKYFLESHPHIRKSYPNLVMIVLNIQDNRIEGESSNFAKMLKGISNVNAIDNRNPNVVVVLTHATSIARNPKRWEEKVELKKAQVQAMVQVHLGINPEIVVQENQPEDNDLEPDGDWYLLPNGDKQPKILFQACKRILNRAKDEIGHEAVAVCFRKGLDKSVKTGQIVSASAVKPEHTQAMHTILLQSVVMVSTSEVGSMLENYKKQKNVKTLDNGILILQVRFRDLGISRTDDLQSMSMNNLMAKMYPIRITKEMQKILEEVFGLSYEQSAGFDYHVGKGYNIFKDSATQFSPLVMQENDKIQYGLPANVKLKECASFEIKCESIKDNNDYVSQRLRELHVDTEGGVNFGSFNLQLRSGYNESSVSSNSATQTLDKSSFLVEHRIQQVEVRQPYTTTDNFKADVKALPADYDLIDENNLSKWKAFFDKWGMYVVTGAYIGGSLTGQVKVVKEQSANSTFEDAQTALAIKMSFLQNDAALDFSKEEEQSNIKKNISTIHSLSLNWSGGNRKTYKTSLENIDRNDWIAWVESLEYSPVPLWSSLDLVPLYHLVSEVSPEKGTKMQMAMNLALKGEFTYTQPTVDNRNNAAPSNSNGGGCFHEDSLVMLHNRKLKRIKHLSVGDKILTMDNNGTLAQDEVTAWIHQVKTGQFKFLQIVHDLGIITLTPEHIIFVGKSRNPQHASNLRPGDELSFFTSYDNRQTVTMAIVSSIHKVEGRGIYAPLTYSGRLLVDSIDVSCYCTLNPLQIVGKDIISSHALAHAGFFPLRMAFKFGLNISSSQFIDESGIHSYARFLMNVILG
ncbi:uncharacterized protein LOC127738684 [Mytilus californianus]|uniref:uncharacterized protein LOC127738684 n=1 Tax=Mytilus californianus TaxID=6549 RepID=UPI0022459BDD|nr:uncharacterized protein LOC127738684 [Mytilus californianus]